MSVMASQLTGISTINSTTKQQKTQNFLITSPLEVESTDYRYNTPKKGQ